ncbi:MAG: elongation factor Ts [Minisyncoccia bacterium]
MVDIEKLKQLREETLLSLEDCKMALEKANGDLEKARIILRELGKESLKDRSQREIKAGIVSCYQHSNKKIGVLVELNCETDFVAKSEEFEKLAHELSLQIAALKPLFLKEEDIPPEILEKEKNIYLNQLKEQNKPKEILNKIVEGKLAKYKNEVCLLNQPWIKDEKRKISDLIKEYQAKFGEKIEIKRFVRFEI